MRSARRTLPLLSLGLACAVVIALLGVACAHATPSASGAVGGAWQTVDRPFFRDQRITALLPAGPRSLWVGAEERGLARWDGSAWRAYGVREGLPDSHVIALFLDHQSRVWVSTGSGLGYLPPDGGAFQRVGLNGLRSLPVLAFAQAEDGGILLGEKGGLDLWQPGGTIRPVPDFDGLEVTALQTGRDGTIWAGTAAGLWRGATGEWQREPSVGDGRVTAIAEGADGRLYVAGATGLWEGRSGAWRRLPAPVSGEMTALAAHDGAIWIGTPQGVIAGQEEAWGTYDPGFLPQSRVTAIAWSDDGLFWVGTTAGLVAHLPDSEPPEIAIIGINGVQPDSGEVQLATDRLDRIELAAHDRFTPGNRLLIFTRLEGVDAAPRLLTEPERRDLRAVGIYAGRTLAPGRYVLRAWAQDEAFNRSAESQVTITIPRLVRGPAGLAILPEPVFAVLGGFTLLFTAGATTRVAGRTRQRRAEHRARAAAARIRDVAGRSADFYSARLPLRQQQVHEAATALQGQSLLLLGQLGMGKTTMLGQVGQAISATDDRAMLMTPASVGLARIREQELFQALMAAATEALYPLGAGARPRLRWSDDTAADYGEPQFSADLGLLLAWLQPQLRRRLCLVFLLDDAQVLDGYARPRQDAFRRLMFTALGANSSIRLALAAEGVPDALDGFADVFRTVSLAPLDHVASKQLLREGTLGFLAWDPEAETSAIKRAAGNPAKLAALGRSAAQAALAGNRLRIMASDVS